MCYPDGFQRIRYYGFLGNRYREEKLARCRQLLGMPVCAPPAAEATKDYLDRYEELTGSSLEGVPSLSSGTYGESRGPATQPQVPNGNHGHVMTPLSNQCSDPGEPAWPGHAKGLVLPRGSPQPSFHAPAPVVRHSGCLFEAPWLPAAIRTPVFRSPILRLTGV